MLMNLTQVSDCGKRVFYPLQGTVESVIETRMFLNWLWLKKIKRITISLSYPPDMGKFKTIYCWDEYETEPPETISIFSNNFSFEVGESLDLEMGYAEHDAQVFQQVPPFAFKLEGQFLY
jgi:hypothetical protein